MSAKRQADWRRKNPDYKEHARLKRDLRRAEQVVIKILPATAPLAKLPWRLVQTELGPKATVLLAFALRLQVRQWQTDIGVKIRVLPGASGPHGQGAKKMAIEGAP